MILQLAASIALAQQIPSDAEILSGLEQGDPGAEARAEAAVLEDLPAKSRRQISSMLCQLRGMRGRYADAARSCEAAALIDPEKDRDSVLFWRALAQVPPPRAVGSAVVAITKDWADLSEIATSVNGIGMRWAVDTGAEMSIIPASLALKLGVRLIGQDLRIESSTLPVNSRVGVIDVLRIGDAYVENVPVIVLPDTQFDMGEGRELPPLLGLPVLVSFGRIAWLDGQARLALGELAPAATPGAQQLYWHDDGIGLRVAAARGSFVAHLDTGANRTNVYPDAVEFLSVAERAAIHLRQTSTGGAGGVLAGRQAEAYRLHCRDHSRCFDTPFRNSRRGTAWQVRSETGDGLCRAAHAPGARFRQNGSSSGAALINVRA